MLDLIPRIRSGRRRPVAARSAGRRILVWTGRILAVLLGLALLGAGYESVSEAADARAYPPPGRMVDVGGYPLHINCVGTAVQPS
ncbi:MAG: hypothetical protein JO352_34300 [Chloroflexi bacterium]|nr:hypothetical protein [Chloroflexota bacterium]